ncbi:prepilin peptidase [Paenibacillus hexagrammi]|uniref:Prepilin peptidase n=1 Tax=Paenibacillus hexagrammi TaxID=2908839 RepID=A0ABY3SQL8_9BACL|nr:A24 family peptidase [Paenibacillus sp. YPD9-1]UJF35974.1 prepilin peptidase [Paenibacillus sp. YPD9-1]
MTILISVYIFLLGLVLGSFFNVVALRVPEKKSIVHPPSACPKCGTRLKTRDLFPVVSYLFSLGRCRYCKTKVSPIYPLGELTSALLFLWIYLHFGNHWETVIGLALVSLLVIITISDLFYMLIPDKVLLAFLPFVLVFRMIIHEQAWWSYLLGAIAGYVIVVLIVLISKGGMGMGDAKLLFVCGFVVGLPHIVLAFVIACFIGTVVGGGLLLLKITKKKTTDTIWPIFGCGHLAFLWLWFDHDRFVFITI